MMLSTKTFEVFQHCPSAGCRILMVERNRVVNIADDGRAATSGEAAGEIPAAHGALQCRRRLIAQRFYRTRQRIGDENRCGVRQSANLLGVDDSVTDQIAGRIAAAVDGLFAGHHIDNDPCPAWITGSGINLCSCRAVRLIAGAGQAAALGQRGERIGTALIQRPGVGRTHLLGELGESAVKGRCGRRGDISVDLGHSVAEGGDCDAPVVLGGLAPFRGGVGVDGPHGGVDRVDDSLP
jgi:hypothetical protein